MTTLMAERRPNARQREDAPHGVEGRQESLFGGEAVAPPRPPTPMPWQARVASAAASPASRPAVTAGGIAAPASTAGRGAPDSSGTLAAPASTAGRGAPDSSGTLAAPDSRGMPRLPGARAVGAVVDGGPEAPVVDVRPDAPPVVDAPRSTGRAVVRPPGSPLARPTLDDAVSRAWEGLLTGLPAPCPVCGGELRSSLGGPLRGSCGSCGTSID